jgi:hypothetical protein
MCRSSLKVCCRGLQHSCKPSKPRIDYPVRRRGLPGDRRRAGHRFSHGAVMQQSPPVAILTPFRQFQPEAARCSATAPTERPLVVTSGIATRSSHGGRVPPPSNRETTRPRRTARLVYPPTTGARASCPSPAMAPTAPRMRIRAGHIPAGDYSAMITCSVRGPCTPSTRSSSISLVALGPLIHVCGQVLDSEAISRATASGTSLTIWSTATMHTWTSGTSETARRP